MNNKNIESYGYSEFFKTQMSEVNLGDGDLIPARVIEVHREKYKVISDYGENGANLKGSLFYNDDRENVYPVIGDFVLIKHNPIGEETIYKVFERKSKFSRMDSFNKIEQLVAVNFDYVFIMTSLNHDFNVRRIERYLTAAWQSGAIPLIILTKADLCEDYSNYLDEIKGSAIGVPVFAISSLTGEGLDELTNYIKPAETIVFLGSSGVGKSSLVNAIAGKEVMKVNDIREDDSKGRHTTTHRQLVMLDNGTMIIDTPGMRELEMWNVSEGINSSFDDISEYASRCKFSDCSHQSEPGCAVKAALKSGELSEERWENYLKLKKEARFAEWKESLNIRLKEKAMQKSRSKFQRAYQKERG